MRTRNLENADGNVNELLKDKSAIVIGGARGIGVGIAEVFSKAGCRLLVADLDGDAAQRLAERLGPAHIAASVDVSDRAECDVVVQRAVDSFRRVDILVQNAGIFPWTTIEHISVAEWDRVLAVNLRGCFVSAQACLPVMRSNGGGRMIFTSSITGPRVSSPGHGHYSASKAGINGFIRAAALEFARWGITVNGVEPGNIMTEGMETTRSAEYIRQMESSVPLGRLGTPAEVGNACLFLASDLAAYITGTTVIVDGGQILPEGGNLSMEPS